MELNRSGGNKLKDPELFTTEISQTCRKESTFVLIDQIHKAAPKQQVNNHKKQKLNLNRTRFFLRITITERHPNYNQTISIANHL